MNSLGDEAAELVKSQGMKPGDEVTERDQNGNVLFIRADISHAHEGCMGLRDTLRSQHGFQNKRQFTWS